MSSMHSHRCGLTFIKQQCPPAGIVQYNVDPLELPLRLDSAGLVQGTHNGMADTLPRAGHVRLWR